MATTRLEIQADPVLDRYWNAIALAGAQARPIIARAVNRTVDASYTQVVKALVKQTSAPRKVLTSQIRKHKAAHKGFEAVEGSLSARGRPLPLSVFRPRQFAPGVKAKVWGRRQLFRHAFGAPGGPPALVARLGGHVFVRVGRERLPIHQLYGPSIPKEMLKDESAKAFNATVADVLPRRIEHELFRIVPGAMPGPASP